MRCSRLSRAARLRHVGRRRGPLSVAATVRRARRGPQDGFLPAVWQLPGRAARALFLTCRHRLQKKELPMPVILWLLGVPLVVVILLMLLHVI